ncbi:MAG: hypothetical protein OSB62_05570 [Alphaproteobacteria bacterium]|nr:hypothetical protein [Alphaproteobacteria bacterium]
MKTDVVQGLPYSELRAFHGDAAVKAEPLERLKAWKDAGEIRLDRYGYNASQYTLNQLWEYTYLQPYGIKLGISPHLAAVENMICKNLPKDEAAEFAVDFLEQIAISAQSAYVFPRLAVWMIQNSSFGLDPMVIHAPSAQIVRELATVCEQLESLSGEELYQRLENIKTNAEHCEDYHSHEARDAPSDYKACRASSSAISLCQLMQSIENLEDSPAFLYKMHKYAEQYPGWVGAVRDKLLELLAAAPVPEKA